MGSTIERMVVAALCLLVTLAVAVSVATLPPSQQHTTTVRAPRLDACVMSRLQTSWQLRAENAGQAPDPHFSGLGREASRSSRSASRS